MRETDWFSNLIQLQHADSMGNCQKSVKDFYLAASGELGPAVVADRILSGRDLIDLGFKPGPRFGEILDAVQEEQDANGFENRQAALSWVSGRFEK
jgi:hypothetical protein